MNPVSASEPVLLQVTQGQSDDAAQFASRTWLTFEGKALFALLGQKELGSSSSGLLTCGEKGRREETTFVL